MSFDSSSTAKAALAVASVAVVASCKRREPTEGEGGGEAEVSPPADVSSEPVGLEVNGVQNRVVVAKSRSLLEVLRGELELRGTKYGCGEAQCGACTVLVDGRPVRSCVRTASACVGQAITTIEGLARDGELHPVQEAFIAEEAMQCGYCTPGMIMSAVGLLNAKPNPSEAEILAGMKGNICRCGTYPRIVRAIQRAAAGTRDNEGGEGETKEVPA